MGRIGRDLAERLGKQFEVVGLDLPDAASGARIPGDLTDDASVRLAFSKIEEKNGRRIASVFHFAAYFDFIGSDSTTYEAVNVGGIPDDQPAITTYGGVARSKFRRHALCMFFEHWRQLFRH